MLSYRLKVSSPYSPENVLIPTKSENLKEPPPLVRPTIMLRMRCEYSRFRPRLRSPRNSGRIGFRKAAVTRLKCAKHRLVGSRTGAIAP